jgi:signal transduction histidine kinase
MAEIFARNFIAVYFFYGLSFFCMGLAVLLEVSHSSELDFSRALRPLAGFGLSHGSHEWIEMFLLIRQQTTGQPPVETWIAPLRVVLLAVSFLLLVAFGARLITGLTRRRLFINMLTVVTAIWAVGLIGVLILRPAEANRLIAADVYTRYALAIPGAALTVWGLALQRRQFFQAGMYSFGRDVALAALAFGLYGGIGQLFASPSAIFPSAYLNADVFVRWFGFPVQVFRALTATMAAFFIIRSLRAFEVESNRRINTLREAQLAEQHRMEMLRAELLHRTVKAQENERRRISRELHDETGQTLTALGMGLRGLSDTIANNPPRAVAQAQQLETLALTGIKELQRMVSGLHPPQLDDLGLLAALRWYAGDVSQRFNLPVNIQATGPKPHLSSDIRAVVFRIAQEAITNVMRHAQASTVNVTLDYTPTAIHLRVEDDGIGFDVEEVLKHGATSATCWGLLGMQERAALVGGDCQIRSQPGQGTSVEVTVPLTGEMAYGTDQAVVG